MDAKYINCFINRRRATVLQYNGANYLLSGSQNWHNPQIWDYLCAEGVSKCGHIKAMALPAGDDLAAVINSAIPCAVVAWEGTPEFDALKNKDNSPAPAPAPAVDNAAKVDAPAVDFGKLDLSGYSSLQAAASLMPALSGELERLYNSTCEHAAKVAAEGAPSASIIRVVDNSGAVVREVPGVAHKDLQKVVNALTAGVNVYLYGPAGTGKTNLAVNAAEALGREYSVVGRLESAWDYIGAPTLNNGFAPGPVLEAMINGRILILDEMDSFQHEAIIAMNSIIANGVITCAGGTFRAAEGFVVVGVGNTTGRGATSEYNREHIDASVLDRFGAKFFIGNDDNIEKTLSRGQIDIVEFVHALRAAAVGAGIELILSPRCIDSAARLCDCFLPGEIVANVFCGGLLIDDIKILAKNIKCNGANKYYKALQAIAL